MNNKRKKKRETPLNINLIINNERQDRKNRYSVCVCTWYLWEGEDVQWKLMPWKMVGGLHILEQNRTKKPLAIVWSGAEGVGERDGGGDLTNVQYKPIWNCHNDFPLHNEHILIKNFKKDKSNKCWWECGGTGLWALLGEMKWGCYGKTAWRLLRKLKIEPHWVPLLGAYPKTWNQDREEMSARPRSLSQDSISLVFSIFSRPDAFSILIILMQILGITSLCYNISVSTLKDKDSIYWIEANFIITLKKLGIP
jgi:hypothetical protein